MCMSIVASAFQYGCAPTLMPRHDDVDLAARLREAARSAAAPPRPSPCSRSRSPSRCARRRRPRTTRPARRAARRGRARRSRARTRARPASPARASGRRAAPRAASPRGSARCGCGSGRRRCSPCWWPACGRPGRARPSSSRSCSSNSPSSSLTISAGCTSPRRRAEMIRWAPSSSGCSGSVGGPPSSTVTPRPAGLNMRSTRSRSSPSSRMRRRSWTSSSPSPALMRAKRLMTALASAGVEVDRGPGVEQQPVPVQPLARRAAGLERAHGLERLRAPSARARAAR